MKKTKFVTICTLSLFILSILASCGNESDKSSADVTEEKSIQIWTNLENEATMLNEYGEKWEKETGNKVEIIHVTPDIQKFAQASKSENGPDGVFGIANDQLANYIEAGLVEEVPEDTFSNADYVDSAVQAVYFDGKRYGVPIAVETNTLFYNTDKVNDVPQTMEELIKVAEKNGGIQFEATSIYYDLGFLRSFDSYIFNYSDRKYDTSDIGLGDDGAVQAYSYINSLANEKEFFSSDITSDIAKGNFQSGETAFYIGGPWDIEGLESAGTPFDVAPMPTLNNKNFVTPVGTQVGFVSAESPDKDAVWEFYEYLLENVALDLYNIGGRIPAQLEAQQNIEKDKYTDAFIKQISFGEPMPTVSEIGQVWTPFADNMKLMIQGEITPEEAAKHIEEQVNTGIELMNSGK